MLTWWRPRPRAHRGNAAVPVASARLPSLAARLADPTTSWAPLTVPSWYGQTPRTLEAVSDTALWYRTGQPPVPLHGVLLRAPAGGFPPQALLCTDRDADPTQIVSWFVLPWQRESTFHEVRDHLGVETGRGWSEKTIRRTTPALLGLFSFVTLVAHDQWNTGHTVAKGTAWYPKTAVTFGDALALVRRSLWGQWAFQASPCAGHPPQISPAFVAHVCDTLCFAA